jgi:hypothetical protein
MQYSDQPDRGTMLGRTTDSDIRRRWTGRAFAAAAVILFATRCATNRYMGISLAPGAAGPVVQALASPNKTLAFGFRSAQTWLVVC